MTVLVIMTVPGDTDQFEAFMKSRASEVIELSEKAKAMGAMGHRFAISDGHVIAVDYWESAERFQEFISAPELQAVMAEMGARGEPQVTIAMAKGFPGEF